MPKPTVVQVICLHSAQANKEPWKNIPATARTGTATCVRHNGKVYIITNEHVVKDNTSCQVSISGMARKFPVEIVYTDKACDLAIIKVSGSNADVFLELVEPKELDTMLPKSGSKVEAQGYSVGGNEICVTSGTISRIEGAYFFLKDLLFYKFKCQHLLTQAVVVGLFYILMKTKLLV